MKWLKWYLKGLLHSLTWHNDHYIHCEKCKEYE